MIDIRTFSMIKSVNLLYLFPLFVLISCTVKSGEKNNHQNEPLPIEQNRVEIMVLKKNDFFREIVTNGKLAAIEKAGLYFQNSGIIKSISVKNGQWIEVGKEIARLQDSEFLFSLQKAELAMEKATIDRLDALLSMGHKSPDDDIPSEHINIANIRSGYNQAKIQYDEALYHWKNISLSAPFSGKVEGILQKTWEKTDLSKPFCTLINDNRFTIEFPLLETEIHEIKTGQKISVTPVAGLESASGWITEINPRIDENGLVRVKAEVNNPGGYIEGMNVKVSIKKAIPDQLVVPKQAVVLRQNREVLFRYTGGIAYWTYIEVLDENEREYAVTAAGDATLAPNDTIIISNNLNLAHEAKVEIE